MPRKIFFIDSSRSLQLDKIGGTNSIVRRLIEQISETYEVILLDINGKNSDLISIDEKVSSKSFPNISNLILYISKEKPAIIVDIYLHPIQRLVWGIYRIVNFKHYFCKIYFSWPDNFLKRILSFSDSIFFRYNGKVFCITERQLNLLRSLFIKNTILLWPPIPESYYKKEIRSENLDNEKIIISWIGRLDNGKGADLAFDILKFFEDDDRFEIKVLAHSLHNDKSIKIPDEFLNNPKYEINIVSYDSFNESLDKNVSDLLKETTIFICPYRLLSSTIDCPMLIQEAAAANCIIVSKDYPIIMNILGAGRYLISSNLNDSDIVSSSLKKISCAIQNITEEQKRLLNHVESLEFSSNEVGSRFISSLSKYLKD